MLKQHRSQLEEMRVKAGDAWTENDLVFPNIYGRFIDKGNFYRVFQKLLKKAGLPHIRFHDLRHSAATILLSMGVSIKVIQNLLGHSTIKTTLDTYGHVLPSMHDDAMDKWDDLFGG